jgi:hypothetical protein
MTNPAEADLARLEADCDAWQRGQITAERVAAIMETDLPALVAYVRELREALEPFAALGRAADWKDQLRGAVAPFKEKWQNAKTGEEAVLTWQDFGRAARMLEPQGEG